jgi:arylsulfatase A-like enzyme
VIFTSDNGPVVDDGYQDQAVERLGDHRPAGTLRGGKYSAFEGGTRVPFIARWPQGGKIGVSDALISQVDLPATLAALTGQTLQPDDAPDSWVVLPAILGNSRKGRDHLVEHAGVLSLRQGPWKLIEPGNGPKVFSQTQIESGQNRVLQLYDVVADPGETNNLANAHPERIQSMTALLEKLKADGRSRP